MDPELVSMLKVSVKKDAQNPLAICFNYNFVLMSERFRRH